MAQKLVVVLHLLALLLAEVLGYDAAHRVRELAEDRRYRILLREVLR